MFTRNVNFTTAVGQEDLLQNATVKASIMEGLGIQSSAVYDNLFVTQQNGEKQGIYIMFDIVFATTNAVSINGQIYNDGIEGIAYSSNSAGKVYSMRVQNAGSGTLAYRFI